MKNTNTDSFTSGDMGMGGGNSKEVIYMTYILNTLSEARKSFDDGDTQRFNLYMSFLKNSILDKKTRDAVDREMLEEEKRLKKLNYDDKFIEFGIGFIVVREIMAYINETLELTHDDIIGEVGRLDDDYEDEEVEAEDEDNIVIKPTHIKPDITYQSYPVFSKGKDNIIPPAGVV